MILLDSQYTINFKYNMLTANVYTNGNSPKYLEAEAKLEITVFGMKIINWNPKYDPEPNNWRKYSMDWMKIYMNNPYKIISEKKWMLSTKNSKKPRGE